MRNSRLSYACRFLKDNFEEKYQILSFFAKSSFSVRTIFALAMLFPLVETQNFFLLRVFRSASASGAQ